MQGDAGYRKGLRSKTIFIVFLILFTIFGGGRIYGWAQVCQDKEGWLYEVNTRRLHQNSDGVYELRMRVSREGHSFQQDWTLDVKNRVLSTDGEPPQQITSGSVASQVALYLEQRKKGESEVEL